MSRADWLWEQEAGCGCGLKNAFLLSLSIASGSPTRASVHNQAADLKPRRQTGSLSPCKEECGSRQHIHFRERGKNTPSPKRKGERKKKGWEESCVFSRRRQANPPCYRMGHRRIKLSKVALRKVVHEIFFPPTPQHSLTTEECAVGSLSCQNSLSAQHFSSTLTNHMGLVSQLQLPCSICRMETRRWPDM